MTISVDILRDSEWDEYSNFVFNCGNSLIYHSRHYLSVVSKIVETDPLVLIARKKGRVVGTIASFLRKSDDGNVLNSMPYFGSHGDLLLADDCANASPAAEKLALELGAMAGEHEAAAVNIVGHPLNPVMSGFASAIGLQAWDMRIGQMSSLPCLSNREDALDSILAACTQKTRNLVRKGLRQRFEIRESDECRDWDLLIEAHTNGMLRIGGTPKSANEFIAIRETFRQSGQCRLYVAERDGIYAGGLVLLYHKNTVEYFIPVAVEVFRNEQVLSALIAHAMCDSILRGSNLWNWGGTWPSQAGVYHFKKGWGAVDRPYTYWGRISNSILAKKASSELREEFRYFYVRPFQQEPSQVGR